MSTSTTQNFVRSGLTGALAALVDLTVSNPQALLSTSNPQFSSALGVIYAGDMIYLTPNNGVASLSNSDGVAQPNTTSSTATVAVNSSGTVVTPASMQGIFVGSQLVVDTGTQQETVAVTAITATTFTATFTKTHASGFAIRDRQVMLQSTTSITGGGYGTAGAGTALTVGALGNNFTVNEFVQVNASAAGKGIPEIAQVTAKAATTITIATQGTYTQPFAIETVPINTVGNTNVGSQTIVVANASGIAVGTKLLIDTVGSGVQETVTVTAVAGTSITANFLNAHSAAGYPVVLSRSNANAATFLGISVDTYPYVVSGSAGQTISGPFPSPSQQKIQYRREGEYRLHTTVGDTLTPGLAVYLGADGQTVQATANGRSIGVVATDQRSVGVLLGASVAGAAGQDVNIRINPAI